MKSISKQGWMYLVYGLAVCGYFTAAAVGHWRGPDFGSGGSSFTGGSSYSRGWGGSWGGGK